MKHLFVFTFLLSTSALANEHESRIKCLKEIKGTNTFNSDHYIPFKDDMITLFSDAKDSILIMTAKNSFEAKLHKAVGGYRSESGYTGDDKSWVRFSYDRKILLPGKKDFFVIASDEVRTGNSFYGVQISKTKPNVPYFNPVEITPSHYEGGFGIFDTYIAKVLDGVDGILKDDMKKHTDSPATFVVNKQKYESVLSKCRAIKTKSFDDKLAKIDASIKLITQIKLPPGVSPPSADVPKGPNKKDEKKKTVAN